MQQHAAAPPAQADAADAGERVYTNAGNRALLELLGADGGDILDVGCGAGDNAALIAQRYPRSSVFGITRQATEARLAAPYLSRCWVFDLEREGMPDDLAAKRFDVLLLSHVLEHLAEPATVLARLTTLLRPGGRVLIAVPNILYWQTRLRLAAGRFEYASSGALDNTHLRFFTYETADRYLLARTPDLRLVSKGATGSVPLWWLRRYAFPSSVSRRLDTFGSRRWSNLFGSQVLLCAIKTGAADAPTAAPAKRVQ